MALSQVNIDFLLSAPKENEIAIGYVEPKDAERTAFFFRAFSILGGHFAILEVKAGVKGTARPDWEVTEVLEPKNRELNEFVLGLECLERAQEIYEEQSVKAQESVIKPQAREGTPQQNVVSIGNGKHVGHLRVIK